MPRHAPNGFNLATTGNVLKTPATKIAPGQQFGRLTALFATDRRKWGQVVWRCRCDCTKGKELDVATRNLTAGRTRSCGCLGSELVRARNRENAWHDLSREIAELAAVHGLAVHLPERDITWKSTVVVECPGCGHKRSTEVANFLRDPIACRHCNSRMTIEELRGIVTSKGISVDHIEYGGDKHGRSIAHCKCDVCGGEFPRPVGELASGNRGCPQCLNIQEREVRTILTYNFGGIFQTRVRPKWMGRLELDGWNEDVSIQGRTLAFEYNGKYWHSADVGDGSKSQRKKELCDGHGVILFVVWALADRPTWDEQLKACQNAIGVAGIDQQLALPPPSTLREMARMIPPGIRNKLIAMNHEPIEFDPGHQGYITSRCLLTGEIVSQALFTLTKLRGCKYCQSHSSRMEERQSNAKLAWQTLWQQRRAADLTGRKINDEIVAYIRNQGFLSDAEMADEVDNKFGIRISPSGLGYARSGKTHSHLNAIHLPVRKSASNYTKDHAAVKHAIDLRSKGLALREISEVLFRNGYQTLKGMKFSATQVKNFLRFA